MRTVCLALLLAGCGTTNPTPYQTKRPNHGGYEDTKLDEDKYRVSFAGNHNTPTQTVWDYFLYRCSELTTQAGYTHFLLVGMNEGTRSYYAGGGGPGGRQEAPVFEATVKMIRAAEAEGNKKAFDARELLKTLAPKIRR